MLLVCTKNDNQPSLFSWLKRVVVMDFGVVLLNVSALIKGRLFLFIRRFMMEMKQVLKGNILTQLVQFVYKVFGTS